jgi:ribonuclease-3
MKQISSFNQLYLQKTTVSFSNLDLPTQALTHDSMGADGQMFERMEFLGDGCLEMAIAHLLVIHTEFSEGQMSQLRSRLTSRESLSGILKSWHAEPWLRIGKAMDIKHLPNTVYADFFESLLGALFLDQGFEATHKVVEHIFLPKILVAKDSKQDFASPKTQLQNWTMARKLPLPNYKTIEKKGPPHAPIYKVEVLVNEQSFIASSTTVKKAEFLVAEKAIASLAGK